MNDNINKENVADLALKALLYEVSISPKPGLVSRYSNGSHKDMNFYTFVNSSISLREYFLKCFEYGTENDLNENFFQGLRSLGKEAEEKMFSATSKINTHKGTIFSMGIFISTFSLEIKNRKKICLENIVEKIKEISFSLDNELEKIKIKKTKRSAGEEIFIKYGIKGARGLALSGYEIVLLDGIKRLKEITKFIDFESSCILLLVYYISILDDTNIINRANIETLNLVKTKATKIFNNNSSRLNAIDLRKEVEELNEYFIRKNISPGGSADLLIITIFIYFLDL